MAASNAVRRRIYGLSLLAAAGAGMMLSAPAAAQFFDDRYPFFNNRRSFEPQDERPADYSRAPAPAARKPDAPQPSVKILVLGDSTADWLAYGLEDGLAESPEIGIVRKHKAFSGLIRYETKPDAPEWPQVAHDIIAAEKPQAVIFIVGLQDRQAIREKIPAKPAAGQAEQNTPEQKKQDGQGSEQQPVIAAPELQRARTPGVYEFHSEKWEELYKKRIDDMIAALKSGGVPVLWVGLPAIRGARSTGEASYLDELYRDRAEQAGIVYVDVWDGFVDEQGRFTTRGPDFEGQIRPLRTPDGVHFTKSGARKLAHYVDRELSRLTLSPIALAMPAPQDAAPDIPNAAKPGTLAPRPLAGPVLLLNAPAQDSTELLGGAAPRQSVADGLATRLLVKGEPIASAAGRADDFSWPPRAPNTKFDGQLPASGPPVVASRPAPAKAAQAQPGALAPGARVAGQPVLQSQIQPQRPGGPPPLGWRPPSSFGYPSQRGFFGMFR